MERGQAMVLFALLAPLVLLPAAGYGAEAALVAARHARLAEIAVVVALDAAQELDVGRLRAGGGAVLDSGAATRAVASEVAGLDSQAVVDAVTIAGNALTVKLEERVPLQVATLVPGAAVVVRASASSALAAGLGAPS